MNIQVALDAGPEAARDEILKGLSAYNERFLGPSASTALAVTARDDDGRIVGGAAGRVWHDRLFIDLVWVDEAHRGQGLGSRVVREIEAQGWEKGARRVLLDTFTFQAAPFYEKLGYVEAARIRHFFGEYDRIYMTKEL